MDTATIILIALGIYALIMVAIGLLSVNNEDTEGFVIGNRNVGLIPTIGSLSAGFRDGSGIVFWVGAGATSMFGGLWLIAGVLVGYLFFSLVGSSVRKRAVENGYITVGQIIKEELGGKTEKVTSLIVVSFSLMLVAMQLFVSGNLISSLSPLGANTSIIIVAVTVGLYLLSGGYGNVIKTDVIQFFLILSLIFLPLFVDFDFTPFTVTANYASYGTSMTVALFLLGGFYVITASDTWQRVFSAKNGRVIHLAFPISAVMLLLMTLSLLFLGLTARGLLPNGADWGNSFFLIFEHQVFPPYLLAYVAIVCIAITMSTLDTLSYLCASTFLKNIVPQTLTEKREDYVHITRICLLVVLAIGALLATYIGNVIKYLFDAASLLFILTPIYVMAGFGWFKKSPKIDLWCALSTVLSVIVYIYMFKAGYFADLILIYIPALINIILCACPTMLSHITKTNKQHKIG
jgi:Na+/proline symporter